ncbi:MAG: hypothetical protein V4631_10085 [Pseudomonadota bacterium]
MGIVKNLITNRHRMATNLAMQDTILEIDRLWNAIAGKPLPGTGLTMDQAFAMSKDELSNTRHIGYQLLFPKDVRP